MSAFLSPIFGAGAQLFNNSGIPLAGGQIWTYVAGTTTPTATWVDSTQGIANTNPIILDASGRPPSEIWLTSGLIYKFVVQDSTGATVGYTYDNISGVNDPSISAQVIGEWINGSTPTYISATQYSVPGNQTTTYTVNRRVRNTVSGGQAYSTVTASSFGAGVTTVTVSNDSIALDNGISITAYSILNASPISVPATVLTAQNYQNQTAKSATTTGTSAAYVATLPVAPSAYLANQEFFITFHTTNAAAATLNINGLGALPLYKPTSGNTYTPVTGGELATGWMTRVVVPAGAAYLLAMDVAWSTAGGGGTGGGTDQIFQLNGTTMSASYAIPAGKNASTVGPLTINPGVTLTIPSGQRVVVL
jgi:hypothetical protein